MTEFSLAKIITKIETNLNLTDNPILKNIKDKLLIIFKKYYVDKLQNSKEQIDNAITKYSEYIKNNQEIKTKVDEIKTKIEINEIDKEKVDEFIKNVIDNKKIIEENITKIEEIITKIVIDENNKKNVDEFINEVNEFINEINDILEQYKNNYTEKIDAELIKKYTIDEGKFNKLFNNKFVNNVNNQIKEKLKTFNTNLGILYINIILKYINKGDDNNIINDLINSFNTKIETINEILDLNQSGGNNLKNNYYYKYFKIKNIF